MSLHNIADKMGRGHFLDADTAIYCPGLGGRLHAWGTIVPSDGTAGYAPGCIFIDVTSGSAVLYLNEGTAASCDFNAIAMA